MRRLSLSLVVIWGLLFCSVVHAGTLYVPSVENSTIQDAINAASNGDIIIVSPGNYTGIGNRDLVFSGKAITVRSMHPDDPCVVASTIIDCQGLGRAFYFHSGEGTTAVVWGITIKNGDADYGGGIECFGASPTIKNCTLSNCTATAYGGGIDLYNSQAIVQNCTITNNTAIQGGGINCDQSNVLIKSCLLTGNSVTGIGSHGCGIYIYDGSSNGGPRILNCTLVNNTGDGTIYRQGDAAPSITNCIIWNNTGAPYIQNCEGFVSYCDITNGYPGTGNISAEPHFAADGYHLTVGSLCINAGDPSGDYTGQTDIDGQSRVINGRIDMGADEYFEPLPDLIVSSLTADTNPIVKPQSTTIRCTIKNQGNADAVPVNYSLKVRLSVDNVYDESDTYVAGRQITINLGPGEQRTETFNFNSGDYETGDFYLVAKVDATNIVTESSENNNTRSLQFTIEPPDPNWHIVQGHVKYSNGVGFGGVTVRLTGNGKNLTDYTQNDGYYDFYGLADGSYTVAAEKTGWVFEPNSLTAVVSGQHVWLADMFGSLLPAEETISKPGTPTGQTSPVKDISYTYTTLGAESNLEHTVEYQFSWGDGSVSAWSTSKSANHSWTSTGEKQISVTARCQTHTDITNISDLLTVTVVTDGPPPPAKKRLIIDTDPAV
ncbi:MAG: right-handed parallel beta-helix repeat-containing protein, partial [Sedimentisphaerales bacterium]|nr:right-handed parallel beta-helix repeat-containing protein [Sedimentisphaerales bacterium]